MTVQILLRGKKSKCPALSPTRFQYVTCVVIDHTIRIHIFITFLFYGEWRFHCSRWVVHYTLVSTKGVGVICCYTDHKLIIASCGDDSAILDKWYTTGRRVATISCATECDGTIVLKRWSARLNENCSLFCMLQSRDNKTSNMQNFGNSKF